ncbi:hypothetical protein SFC07_09475 [Corynebacterium callunae]|uniref:hypothetical protein n=1 Tax=Corynebacterium callunae TaxID=1721 RepID=UPI0039823D32
MSTEYQILSAFRIWRDTARETYSAQALPSDEALIAAAANPELLKTGEQYPELLVWAKPLRRVSGYARVGTTSIIEDGSDPLLFQPDLSVDISGRGAPATSEASPEVVAPAPVPAATPEPEANSGTTAPAPPSRNETSTKETGAEKPKPQKRSRHREDNPAAPAATDFIQATKATIASPSRGGRRRARNTTAQVDSNMRKWESYEFARLDAFARPEPLAGADLRVEANATGGLNLDWELLELPPQQVRLFRIVSDDQSFELDPDFGEHRAVTVGNHWTDNEGLTSAYRMYQVWMYVGTSESTAVRSQPVLIGEKSYILPIGELELSVAGSEVKGQWASAEHTHRVAVFAVPDNERLALVRRNEIATDTANLQGFRFTPQHRGRGYKFVAQRFVIINGLELASKPSDEFTIHVPAEVMAVPIQVVEKDNGFDTTFKVSWQPPHSGDVWIYRTATAPDPELQFNEIEVDQLEGFGLARRDWANDLEGEKSSCTVTWPDDWYSIFITPVNVVGNQAQVGKTHSRVRVGAITNATLHERVNSQLLTFGWPEEAHEVTAVFGETGTGQLIGPTPETPGTSLVSIHQEAYQDEGGMRFPLPGPGDIALFASRVYEGHQIWGEPVVLHYRGVRQFSYELQVSQGRLFLAIFAEREQLESSQLDQFTLRIHRSRLPLEPEDGDEVLTRTIDGSTNTIEEEQFSPGISAGALGPKGPAVVKYWEINPHILSYPPTSFLRLFIRQPADSMAPVNALIDPHPDQLRLQTWIRGGVVDNDR